MGSSQGKCIPVLQPRHGASQTRSRQPCSIVRDLHRGTEMVGCPSPPSNVPQPFLPVPSPNASLLLGLAIRWLRGAAGLCSRNLSDMHVQLPVLPTLNRASQIELQNKKNLILNSGVKIPVEEKAPNTRCGLLKDGSCPSAVKTCFAHGNNSMISSELQCFDGYGEGYKPA